MDYIGDIDDCWEGYCPNCGDECLECVDDVGVEFRCPVCDFHVFITADGIKFVLPRYEGGSSENPDSDKK